MSYHKHDILIYQSNDAEKIKTIWRYRKGHRFLNDIDQMLKSIIKNFSKPITYGQTIISQRSVMALLEENKKRKQYWSLKEDKDIQVFLNKDNNYLYLNHILIICNDDDDNKQINRLNDKNKNKKIHIATSHDSRDIIHENNQEFKSLSMSYESKWSDQYKIFSAYFEKPCQAADQITIVDNYLFNIHGESEPSEKAVKPLVHFIKQIIKARKKDKGNFKKELLKINLITSVKTRRDYQNNSRSNYQSYDEQPLRIKEKRIYELSDKLCEIFEGKNMEIETTVIPIEYHGDNRDSREVTSHERMIFFDSLLAYQIGKGIGLWTSKDLFEKEKIKQTLNVGEYSVISEISSDNIRKY